MEKETRILIENLAKELNTTAEYLWSILLKQAPISAGVQLVQTLIIAIFGICLFKVYKRVSAKTSNYYDSDTIVIIIATAGIIWIIFALIALFSIENMINGFFNPEYWALNKLMKLN